MPNAILLSRRTSATKIYWVTQRKYYLFFYEKYRRGNGTKNKARIYSHPSLKIKPKLVVEDAEMYLSGSTTASFLSKERIIIERVKWRNIINQWNYVMEDQWPEVEI